ncbi:hypothetical protein [Vitiosangium sp. GDMCC 1.1324]|uniref:hypothetical protein n=1 Tax=Vitiosangium sp. (strain GDMCC 1.1324) TaxID=2138576 RepID=UPI001E417E26|nr:hypothetical protein [Vitiosangium sp. GDMCC 1.1324]
MAVYEMEPVSTAMEHNVLRWMAGVLGLPAGSGGVLTSGGSAPLTCPPQARRSSPTPSL